MNNRELFVKTIIQGKTEQETPDQFKERILKAASNVVVADAINAESDTLAGGIDTSIPVDITAPIVTDEIIVDALKRHAIEIEAIRKANQLLINGIASAILAAGTIATGGSGASSFVALLPIVQQLMQTYFIPNIIK